MESINGAIILEKIKTMQLPTPRRAANAREEQIAEAMMSFIRRIENAVDINFEETEELCTIESEENVDAEPVYQELINESTNEVFEYEYVKKVLDYRERYPTHSFATLQSKFRRVKHRVYVTRFKEYDEKLGTVREKFKKISQFVWENYRAARDSCAAVHDRDLKRWAIRKARELNLIMFKASDTWIKSFKRKNNIGNRRVTRFITFNHERKQVEIENSACEFQKDFAEQIMPNFRPEQIMNTDQIGFQYEMHRDRTLSDIGERSTFVRAVNQRAISHSYTVQPLINMAGKIASTFMIVFQERTGSFGPRVWSNLVKPANVYITCSKSGKVEAPILREWTEKCLSPAVTDKACLIVDSFATHRIDDIFSVPGKQIRIKILPPGSTSLIQPLDVLIFRQWKMFVKNFAERVLLDEIDIDLHDRNVIIKLHTIIHNQLRAPLFQPLISNAWARAAYPVEKTFYNTFTDSIFDETGSFCGSSTCRKGSFILCAHCRTHLCLEHLFEPHLHQ